MELVAGEGTSFCVCVVAGALCDGAAVWATAWAAEVQSMTVIASATRQCRVHGAMTGLDEEIERMEVIRWSRVSVLHDDQTHRHEPYPHRGSNTQVAPL